MILQEFSALHSIRKLLNTSLLAICLLSALAPMPSVADTSPPSGLGRSDPRWPDRQGYRQPRRDCQRCHEEERHPGHGDRGSAGWQVDYAKGFGVRKFGESQPVDADTVFQIASLSKSLAATVVAHEVGAGIVRWDTPLVAHLPSFKLIDPWVTQHVTIADMFSHRSGLPEHAGDDLEDLGYDRRTVLERLRLLPLHSFRDIYAYTNFGLTAAAEGVAAASGKDWESLSEGVLYRPLGMTATSSRFADFDRRPNRAFGHVRVGEGFQPKYQRFPTRSRRQAASVRLRTTSPDGWR